MVHKFAKDLDESDVGKRIRAISVEGEPHAGTLLWATVLQKRRFWRWVDDEVFVLLDGGAGVLFAEPKSLVVVNEC